MSADTWAAVDRYFEERLSSADPVLDAILAASDAAGLPRHADVARANIARAGLADRVRLHEGRAIDSLPLITGPFDLIFIDADKPSSPDYLEWALRLARRGGVIVMDNVVRDGAVVDCASRDASVVGVRRAMDRMRNEPRLCATAIQAVGLKGYDGLAIALVLGDDGR